MKKLIIFLLVAASFTACKRESKEIKKANENTVASIPPDSTEISAAPSFTSKEAQDYVRSYDAFLYDYRAAVQDHDQVKLQELANKMIELSAQGNEVLKNLQGEDLTKLTEYLRTRAHEFSQISEGK